MEEVARWACSAVGFGGEAAGGGLSRAGTCWAFFAIGLRGGGGEGASLRRGGGGRGGRDRGSTGSGRVWGQNRSSPNPVQ